MNNIDHLTEILDILQEEAAEVIQAISKCRRFGMDNIKPGKNKSNKQHLEQELGDVLAMIELLVQTGVVQEQGLNTAKENKFQKLKKWSQIDV